MSCECRVGSDNKCGQCGKQWVNCEHCERFHVVGDGCIVILFDDTKYVWIDVIKPDC